MRRSRGFMPRLPRRTIRWGWVFYLLPGILIYWVWTYVRMLNGATDVSGPDGNPKVPLTVSATREVWQGDPIYSVTNQSNQTLQDVSIQNWANKVVGIYAVGGLKRGSDSTAKRFPATLVNLSPGQTLYFLGSAESVAPSPYTLMWSIHGQPYFTTIRIPEPSP